MKSLIFFALFIVVTSSTIVFLTIPDEAEFEKKLDEGAYFEYTSYLYHKGLKSYPDLFKEFINSRYYARPSPLRIGYLLISLVWVKLFSLSYTSLAKLSFFFYLIFLIVCYLYAKKFFGLDKSIISTSLLSCSPLLMGLSRRALTESCTILFVSLCILLFLDFLLEERKKIKIIKFSICTLTYIYSTFVRETSILLLIFFIISFLVYKYHFKRRIPYFYILAMIIFSTTAFIYIFWLITGKDLSLIFYTMMLVKQETIINEVALNYGQGPWFRYLIDYILLSPFTLIFSIGYIFTFIFKKEKSIKISYFSIYFIIFYLLMILWLSKSIRYVLNLDMVIRLFATFLIYDLSDKYRRNFRFIILIMFIFYDYFNFFKIFHFKKVYDPLSFYLLKAHRIIP